MRLKIAAVLVIGAAFVLIPSAKADTFNFNSCSHITAGTPTFPLTTCPGDTDDKSLTYTVGSNSIVAKGFNSTTNLATDLYVKNDSDPTERGLGITNEGEHEISSAYYINLDFSNLFAHGITSGTLVLGSLQAGERFRVCQGSSAGTGAPDGPSCGVTGTESGSTGLQSIALSWTGSTNDVFFITSKNSDSGNVLIESFTTASTVPEPGSLALLSSGLLGLAGLLRRKLV